MHPSEAGWRQRGEMILGIWKLVVVIAPTVVATFLLTGHHTDGHTTTLRSIFINIPRVVSQPRSGIRCQWDCCSALPIGQTSAKYITRPEFAMAEFAQANASVADFAVNLRFLERMHRLSESDQFDKPPFWVLPPFRVFWQEDTC